MSEPRVRSLTPVIPVLDVEGTLRWYQETLGAMNVWTWGEPVDTGGCMLGNAELLFGHDSDLAPHVRGLRYRLNVFGVREFWVRIQASGAKIIRPFAQMPWGSHEFTIEDLNGFEFVFGEMGATRQRAANPITPQIEVRPLTAEEAKDLFVSIGWANPDDVLAQAPAYPFTVVALHEGRVIGAASVAHGGENATVVRDVMVNRDYQGMGIGAVLMAEVESYLKTLPNHPYVFLATTPGLIPFYERFGFSTSDGRVVSMCRHFS